MKIGRIGEGFQPEASTNGVLPAVEVDCHGLGLPIGLGNHMVPPSVVDLKNAFQFNFTIPLLNRESDTALGIKGQAVSGSAHLLDQDAPALPHGRLEADFNKEIGGMDFRVLKFVATDGLLLFIDRVVVRLVHLGMGQDRILVLAVQLQRSLDPVFQWARDVVAFRDIDHPEGKLGSFVIGTAIV